MRRALVPVDACIDHVFRAMATSSASPARPGNTHPALPGSCWPSLSGLAVIRYSIAWTASLRKLSGNLALNAAMPSATLCAPKCSLWCASSASAFGVSCALKLCFMERWTATADLSFLSAELRNVPLRHSATFCEKWTHYTFLRKVVSPAALGRLRHPQLAGSSTRELNTWAGVPAPPRAPFGWPVDNPAGCPPANPRLPRLRRSDLGRFPMV